MSKYKVSAHYTGGIFAGLVSLGLVMLSIASMVQHWITCIGSEEWVLLAFGVIVPPIGFVHGIGVWLGWF